jgi:hypothetical protein
MDSVLGLGRFVDAREVGEADQVYEKEWISFFLYKLRRD